ncbi:MAG: hypothetical protein HY040_20615 [Planctomycetes bacterium]|nr:hypothetical protein [Planctomycetota bacterium]
MKLGKAAQQKLGTLVESAELTLAHLIRARGGTAANVKEAGPWANKTLGEAANAAIKGDDAAAKAIKIVKQARRLGQKF